METKEIDGVLYELVPREEEKSCEGCALYNPSWAICTTSTDNCSKGFVYKKIDKPISTSNLKPFNLEKAKAGKPVCTRDGKKARIICFDAKGKQPIIALLEGEKTDEEIIQTYSMNGSYYEFRKEDHRDLMMLPEKKEGWAVIRKGDIYETEELARKELLDSRTAMMIRKISWEE